jgi:transposase-like protein
MNNDIIKMAREANLLFPGTDHVDGSIEQLKRFEALVRTAEREAIMDEWWMCVQSDLENGVKSLNERAAEKWKKEYPAIAGFAATIEARSNQ